MPARNHNLAVELLGMIAIGLALAGSLVHGAARVVVSWKRRTA